MTFGEVQEKVCRLANYLKSIGVGKGSDVTIYMPMIPELPIAMVGILTLLYESSVLSL